METSRLIPIFVKIFYDVKIKEVVFALERFAPLPLQESYDNAGLQVGLTEVEASGALLCLDVTEEVIDEAVSLGCNLIVSHHPLLFHGLKTVSDRNYVERCVRKAIQNDVTVYAAHTNLDNAEDGVNFKIAEKLELEQVRLLLPHPVKVKDGGHEYTVMAGSGVIGVLPQPEDSLKFLQRIKSVFHIECLMHNREFGLYHASCDGSCSRAEWAREILRLNGMDNIPVVSAAENTELRPRFTLLDNMMLRITGLYQMPDWKTALADYFKTRQGGARK